MVVSLVLCVQYVLMRDWWNIPGVLHHCTITSGNRHQTPATLNRNKWVKKYSSLVLLYNPKICIHSIFLCILIFVTYSFDKCSHKKNLTSKICRADFWYKVSCGKSVSVIINVSFSTIKLPFLNKVSKFKRALVLQYVSFLIATENHVQAGHKYTSNLMWLCNHYTALLKKKV